MAPRFDFERLTLELAVADLLEPRLVASLGFAQRGGFERLWLGQAIHSRYQEAALASDPTYQSEVRVRHTFVHRGWEVSVEGRIDGLRREGERLIVEEIKSVRRGRGLSPAVRELYERQALLYAWLLRERDGIEARAELVLIEIGSGEADRSELTVDFAALEAALFRRLNALLRSAEEARQAAWGRQEAGERLAFPYGVVRPGQEQIVAAVETALANRDHLLIEAPTGIGKTVAALYPTLRHALREGKRLFVLTAKTLQQDMAVKVMRLLNTEASFHTLRLRAKAKMCANGQVLCHEEYCAYARDYYLKLQTSGLQRRLLAESTSLEPDLIFAAAKQDEVCPFEVSLELTEQVVVTVCDYNYAFDPYVALSHFAAESDLSDTILVIDEVHNLLDRGRGYLSPVLSSAAARRAAEAVARLGDPVSYALEDLCLGLGQLLERSADEALEGHESDGTSLQATEAALPEDELWALRPSFDNAFVDYLEHRRNTRSLEPEDAFVDLYFAVVRFLNGLTVADSSFSQIAEREGVDRRLKLLCRDPSRFLGAVIRRTHSTIGLSATLSPTELYRDLLGFEPARTSSLSLPAPFPAEHRRIVIDAAVATSYREREGNYDLIAQRLGELADAVPGNCLALFPSYRFLAEVVGRLSPMSKRLLVQQRADGDREREEILEHLRRSFLGDLLLAAVAGGVFAEGVDYPGDMLRAVAVVGPCLPAVTLEQQLLAQYYEERFDRGFEYAYVVPGMTRVVQAAGRLIRSAEDTGVIALLDRRFLTRPYKDYLPADWVPEEGVRTITGNPARAASEFFRSLGENRQD